MDSSNCLFVKRAILVSNGLPVTIFFHGFEIVLMLGALEFGLH